MSCRIAAWEYTFEKFTDVEIADFNDKQIIEFSKRWFETRGAFDKPWNFIQRLKENKQLQEIATNPLLLTLLCLFFEERDDFLSNRTDLYKEGTRLLLKKWDADREIKRGKTYKKLSLNCKEDLLSYLAFQTFERSDYFFKQSVVEQHIINYIRNLPGANKDDEAPHLDSESVLKSIEAQHGLLVERARGIYSFSHLTFQGYFTARQITSSTTQPHTALKNLAVHITQKRYREVFLLVASILLEADALLLLMKQRIDLLISQDPHLQTFLVWVLQKATSIKAPYHKSVAIRAFYLALNLDHILDSDLDFDLALTLDIGLTFALDLVLTLDLALDRSLALDLSISLELVLSSSPLLNFSLILDHYPEKAFADDPELKLKIEVLKAQIPSRKDMERFKQWWKIEGQEWTAQLRSLMIEHRNIGHDWHFTAEQKERLQQYHDANKLLVDCLNRNCYVTKTTRPYIEDTLLLPMSEIEKYEKPEIN